jgi:ribose 5-phosphate isomerase B
MSKRIAIGSDHRGFLLKQTIMPFLRELGHSFHDFGSYDSIPVDYPDVAEKVGLAVAAGSSDQGILICGTGIGMCIAANKIRGVRAAMCHSTFEAERARRHNDANVLCLSGEGMDADLAREIVRTFLSTDFEGGRHSQRVEKIRGLETGSS